MQEPKTEKVQCECRESEAAINFTKHVQVRHVCGLVITICFEFTKT